MDKSLLKFIARMETEKRREFRKFGKGKTFDPRQLPQKLLLASLVLLLNYENELPDPEEKLSAEIPVLDRFLRTHSSLYSRSRDLARGLNIGLEGRISLNARALEIFETKADTVCFSPMADELRWLASGRLPVSRKVELLNCITPYLTPTFHELNHAILDKMIHPVCARSSRQFERRRLSLLFLEAVVILTDRLIALQLGSLSETIASMGVLYSHVRRPPTDLRALSFQAIKIELLSIFFSLSGYSTSETRLIFKKKFGDRGGNLPTVARGFVKKTMPRWFREVRDHDLVSWSGKTTQRPFGIEPFAMEPMTAMALLKNDRFLEEFQHWYRKLYDIQSSGADREGERKS